MEQTSCTRFNDLTFIQTCYSTDCKGMQPWEPSLIYSFSLQPNLYIITQGECFCAVIMVKTTVCVACIKKI